jgi:hypothetical protein
LTGSVLLGDCETLAKFVSREPFDRSRNCLGPVRLRAWERGVWRVPRRFVLHFFAKSSSTHPIPPHYQLSLFAHSTRSPLTLAHPAGTCARPECVLRRLVLMGTTQRCSHCPSSVARCASTMVSQFIPDQLFASDISTRNAQPSFLFPWFLCSSLPAAHYICTCRPPFKHIPAFMRCACRPPL